MIVVVATACEPPVELDGDQSDLAPSFPAFAPGAEARSGLSIGNAMGMAELSRLAYMDDERERSAAIDELGLGSRANVRVFVSSGAPEIGGVRAIWLDTPEFAILSFEGTSDLESFMNSFGSGQQTDTSSWGHANVG